jgi:hypothetical protein
MELLKLLANRVNNRQPVTPYDRVALPASSSLDMIEIKFNSLLSGHRIHNSSSCCIYCGILVYKSVH